MKLVIKVILIICLFIGFIPSKEIHAEENLFEGKTISILGDSISTYKNYSSGTAASTTNTTIENGAVHYTVGRWGVYLEDTWWQQAIDALRMRLLVNNSWSGSCVMNTRSGTVGGYVDRAVQLHDNTGDNAGEEPDIIAIYLGTNDFYAYRSTIGSFDEVDFNTLISETENGYEYQKPTTSIEAYAIMLHKIIERYPNSEIYCFTLLPRTNLDSSTVKQLEGFNDSIKKTADYFNVNVTDLYENSGITSNPFSFDPYMGDSLHPNPKGMDAITNAFVSSLLENSKYNQQTTYSIDYNLTNILVEEGTRKKINKNEPFIATLLAPAGKEANVTITMNDVDITESSYKDNKITIEKVTGDIHILAYAQNVCKPNLEEYYFELNENQFVSNKDNYYDLNTLTSVGTGIYQLEKEIHLYHDKEWMVEFEAEGREFMPLASTTSPTDQQSQYLYVNGNKAGLVAFGERAGSSYHNYGINLNKVGLSPTAKHVYRFENKVDSNGNKVKMYVDGQYVGIMSDYYISSNNYQSTDENYLSGKDFVFSYIGANSFALKTNQIKYLKVIENIKTLNMKYDDYYDLTGKMVEILDAGEPTSYQVGYGLEENSVHDKAVVTMKDSHLVATGIGEALVSIDGKLTKIQVSTAPISMFLLIGQSNMRGSEGNADQSIICPDGMVYSTFGDDRGATNAVMNLNNARKFAASALTGDYSHINVEGTQEHLNAHPIYSLTEKGNGKIGPDSGFAYEWVKQTGEKVWLVNAAHGGSSITTWQTNGVNYKEALALFGACQETLQKEIAADHYTLSHMGYFWLQGESDQTQSAAWYVQRHLEMHNNFKNNLAFDHDLNGNTEDVTFEFGGNIIVRAGNSEKITYREAFNETVSGNYFETYKDLRMSGPRVAQYYLGNSPEYKDIWNVSNVGDSWVNMPDGTNGVKDYFQKHYENGKVDYKPQVAQKSDWYTPTTPKAVHDSIHYNQIGYNEIGREAIRNTLVYLGINEPEDVETTVKLVGWNGYTEISEINASKSANSDSLIVPIVTPLYKSKEITYELSEGFINKYYDVLTTNDGLQGTLKMRDKVVTIVSHQWNDWETVKDPSKDGPGERKRICEICQETRIEYIDGVWQTYDFANHYQELPQYICSDTNIWTLLEHDPYYFASGRNWGIYTSGGRKVPSVTFSVQPGDKIYATSFDSKDVNGHGNTDGIRLDFFNDYGIVKGIGNVYSEFLKNGGYMVVPEGAKYVSICMWGDNPEHEIYILNREHRVENVDIDATCTQEGIQGEFCLGCGAGEKIVTPAFGHNWSEWEIIQEMNREHAGEKTRNCQRCQEVETELIQGIWQLYDFKNHYQELPEFICSGTNIWSILEHDPVYFKQGENWGTYNDRLVPSVTFSVQPNDKIYATSFNEKGKNGHESINGIRVDFFNDYGIVKSMTATQAYEEFSKVGYITVPENTQYVSIPMWNDSDKNEIYILNREHEYIPHVTPSNGLTLGYTTYSCTRCDHSYISNVIDKSYFEGKKLLTLGDSITYGVGANGNPYPNQLKEALGLEVTNLAASGHTLCTGGHRISQIKRLTENNCKDKDIVTILLGINDWDQARNNETNGSYYALGDINSTDPSTIYGAMRMWCEKIVELKQTSCPNTQFYFMTPMITSWNNSVINRKNWDQSKTNIHGYRLRDLCQAIIEVSTLYGIPVIDLNILSGIYYISPEENNVKEYGGDGVHINEAGHELTTKAIVNYFTQNYLSEDHEHVYGPWIMTNYSICKGEEKRVCQECGKTERRDAKGIDHLFVYYVSDNNATHLQDGTITAKCNYCDERHTIVDEGSKIILGDMNNDKMVNQLDRIILSRYLANWNEYDNIPTKNADVDLDGKVNQLDRTILARHLAKWQGYETLPYKEKTIYYDFNNSILNVISEYSETNDIRVQMNKKGPNSIFDFTRFYLIEKSDGKISDNIKGGELFLSNGTDCRSPFQIKAIHNIDGDNLTSTGSYYSYFTGGNHGYQNSGSLTKENSATGRTGTIRIWADNKEIINGNGYVSELRIYWENFIQASNTTKKDGSGREVLKEVHEIIFDGSTWNEEIKLYPLEEINLHLWYGLQFISVSKTGIFNENVYFRDTIYHIEETAIPGTSQKSSGRTFNEMILQGKEHEVKMSIDTNYDLGVGNLNKTTHNCFTTDYGKVYFNIINGTNIVDINDCLCLKGSYIFSPREN